MSVCAKDATQRGEVCSIANHHLDKQLNLDLELPADFDHVRHDHTIDPDKTANVIPHSLFLLVRVFDNAKPARSSGCLRYPSLNPARLARPHFSTGLDSAQASSRASALLAPPSPSLTMLMASSIVPNRRRRAPGSPQRDRERTASRTAPWRHCITGAHPGLSATSVHRP
jgi:hypothetical protein